MSGVQLFGAGANGSLIEQAAKPVGKDEPGEPERRRG